MSNAYIQLYNITKQSIGDDVRVPGYPTTIYLKAMLIANGPYLATPKAPQGQFFNHNQLYQPNQLIWYLWRVCKYVMNFS